MTCLNKYISSKNSNKHLPAIDASDIMAERGDNNFMRYVYRGEEGEVIPREATHIIVGEDCTIILAHAFREHPNIVEIICHAGVKKIETAAFWCCPNLRRVIMLGVIEVEHYAFSSCGTLTDLECGNLEIIKQEAFSRCKSLRIISLISARIVEMNAFIECTDLTDVKFGNKLERFESAAFMDCTSLERITIPLKDGIVAYDDILTKCENLQCVGLVEGELHETIAALHLDEWRNDMNKEIDSINQILPNAPAGDGWADEDAVEDYDAFAGRKARAIRRWIRSLIRKITRYQEEHDRLLNEAATTLQFALPQDIVTKSVLPLLELPSHTFEVEEEESDSDEEQD